MTAREVVDYMMQMLIDKPNSQWDVKEHKERRSLDSNAYFHVLCDKLRQKMSPPWSMAHMKNHLITSYGQPEYDDEGNMVYLKANIPTEKMAEVEYLHCLPVKYESETVIFYRVYRGSHTYDTKEMSLLIQGTQDECLQVGVEVATPAELARMAASWEAYCASQNKGKSDK